MRTLVIAVALLATTPAYAQTTATPAPAQAAASSAAVTAPQVSASAAGERLAAAMLTPQFVDKVITAFSAQLPQMFDRELGGDPNYRALPAATRDKVRAYMIDATPKLLTSVLTDAIADTKVASGRELARTYSAEQLGGIATFFESADGAAMMNKLLGVATESALQNNGQVTATTGDMINALTGDEIKALAMFTTTPAVTRDGEAIFGVIGKSFTDSLSARTPAVEREMIAGLCAVLSPAERRRLGQRECRAAANP